MRKGGRQRQARSRTDAAIEYIRVPKHWFSQPLHHAMKTVVRPPTARTRRKQLTIQMKIPEEVFIELMSPLESACVAGFEWVDESKTKLLPTEEKPTFLRYKYTVSKPSLLDKIWRLDTLEKEPARKKDKNGNTVPFRRGHGCARIHLSAVAAQRGERTDLLAQVTGNTIIDCKVPKFARAIPTLRIKVSVSTMDKSGHVVWANNYTAGTSAALRKQMRCHLAKMIEDPAYPTLSHMSPALANLMHNEQRLLI